MIYESEQGNIRMVAVGDVMLTRSLKPFHQVDCGCRKSRAVSMSRRTRTICDFWGCEGPTNLQRTRAWTHRSCGGVKSRCKFRRRGVRIGDAARQPGEWQ